ncbi:MAG TPA: adenylate/guanylate cyclase domain-containing protein, partial [Chthonomonadales bacterium]|nr:adenylate/guanylate cyclase domain-containing protein [Chthonomonadales bacterium]
MSLPTGTVTFLFTDIEGSTRLWEEQPEAMNAALKKHDELVAGAIDRAGGHVFKTVGDAFCASFGSAGQAVSAALEAQQALGKEHWQEGAEIRVRMALHTGAPTVDVQAEDYFGPVLNRVARLLSVAHGGQTLVSEATQALCCDTLPQGCSMLPLGQHRLRDLRRPETVYQLCHPDLPAQFPALRSPETPETPNNLAEPLTSFVGREKELAQVKELLHKSRLVTLSGPGGCGKTRLSLQAASEVLHQYPDGIWFVDL